MLRYIYKRKKERKKGLLKEIKKKMNVRIFAAYKSDARNSKCNDRIDKGK